MDEQAGGETRERLLDAAEQLFAEEGFGASLRAITSTAGANVAAVNYHFGNREGLINAVMARRATPINQERVTLLDALLAREAPPTIREVIEAFLCPLANQIQENKSRQKLFSQFVGRMMSQGFKGADKEVVQEFQAVVQLVVRAMCQALPGLDEETAYYRLKFCFSVAADGLVHDEVFEEFCGHHQEDWDWARRFEEVLNFCEGGMKQ